MKTSGALMALLLVLTACGADDTVAEVGQSSSSDPQPSSETTSDDNANSSDSSGDPFVPPADVLVADRTALGTVQIGDQTFTVSDATCQLQSDRYQFSTDGDVETAVLISVGPPLFLRVARVTFDAPAGRQTWIISDADPVIDIWADGLEVRGIGINQEDAGTSSPGQEMVFRADCQP